MSGLAAALVVGGTALAWRVLFVQKVAVAARRRAALGRSVGLMTAVDVGNYLALPGETIAFVPAVGALLVAGLLGAAVLAGPPVAFAMCGAVVAGLVALHRTAPSRRAVEADRDLPIVLEGIARRLRAGAALGQAVAEAGPPSSSALAPAWRRMCDQAGALGLAAAADAWSVESGRPAVRLAAAALALAAETGGAPARAIDGVAATLRAGFAVEAEIRALSSQARASAAVIAVAPLVFGAAAGATDGRTAAFLSTSAGSAMVLCGLSLDAAGAYWMARLCRPA